MNTATLVGRLTRDPEMRVLASGRLVTTLTLEVPTMLGDQTTTEPPLEYLTVQAWGEDPSTRLDAERLPQFCAELSKGATVAVVGPIRTRTWDDDEGHRHYRTEVHALEVTVVKPGRRSSVNGGARK